LAGYPVCISTTNNARAAALSSNSRYSPAVMARLGELSKKNEESEREVGVVTVEGLGQVSEEN